MRITFVLASPDYSGGSRVISLYAKHLHERGHQVTLVSVPGGLPTPIQQLKSFLKGQGIQRRAIRPLSHMDALPMEHRKLKRKRPVVDADVPDADIVIATWWETANWVAQMSPAKGKKVYLVQHYEIFDYLPVEQVKATWRLPLHKVVVAAWLAEIAEKEYGDRAVTYIPNAVDPMLFFAEPRTKQPVPTIGFLYSIEPWKGSDIALQAIARAQEMIPDLRLIAFGHPPEDDPALPVGTLYRRKPSQETIRELYSQCDVWLFSSRFEGFGLPILEAMACRTPVIGTPAGAAPELLANGAGMLVKMADPEDMAQAIVRVCQLSEAEWQTMSTLAYERAISHTWESATDQLEAALRSLLAQAPEPHRSSYECV